MMNGIYQIKMGREAIYSEFRVFCSIREVDKRKPKKTMRVEEFSECFLGNSIVYILYT